MNNFRIILLLISGTCLCSCNSGMNQSTLRIGKGNDVTVTLNILNPKGIQKIEFLSNGNIQKVSANELLKYNAIEYGFYGQGEGSFKVFVYTNLDTLKSENYVEEGYHVQLECDSSHIKTTDFTGIGY